jgi:hypothetical protein
VTVGPNAVLSAPGGRLRLRNRRRTTLPEFAAATKRFRTKKLLGDLELEYADHGLAMRTGAVTRCNGLHAAVSFPLQLPMSSRSTRALGDNGRAASPASGRPALSVNCAIPAVQQRNVRDNRQQSVLPRGGRAPQDSQGMPGAARDLASVALPGGIADVVALGGEYA